MCTEAQARSALEGLGMVDGLTADDVDEHLARYSRLHDVGRRGLAFYLYEVQERRLHQHFGYSSTLEYARHRHELSSRRARELLHVGAQLRELVLIDAAFCAHAIGWTKVLLLLRVASIEHEPAWVEKAKELGINELRREVTLAKKGGPPRDPGDVKGLSAVTFPVAMKLSTIPYKLMDLAQRKLSAERGRSATVEEVFETALRVYIDMERTGTSDGWAHVPSSLFRIHARPAGFGDDASLLVETDDGLMPIDDVDASDAIARQRSACACCDGEHVDADGDPIDPPTPPAMRKRVLVRDKHRCRCCGGTSHLQVHHIVYRSSGGKTMIFNLIALCMRCHALVHDGLLVIEGTTQGKARFLDAEGRSIHNPDRTVDKAKLLMVDAPPRRPLAARAAKAKVVREHMTLDRLPKVVDGAWWKRHAGLIRCRGERGLELRPGEPASEVPAPEPAADALSFDEAFRGIVGQERLLERLKKEADGARALGQAFPHTLFTGPPGTGKTTLAEGVAAFAGSRLVRTNGPAVQDTASLLRLLACLGEGDTLFLDEVHAVPQGTLELLYQAMAEGCLSLTFHEGSRECGVRLDLPAFTVLAATTEPAKLTRAFVSRFALRECLALYEEADLARLAMSVAKGGGFGITEEASQKLASHARGTPRELLRLLACASRHAASEDERMLDLAQVEALLECMGYDEAGLSPLEQRCLDMLRRSADPISGARLARMLGVDEGTLHYEVEALLLLRGLIRIGPRGRYPAPWRREGVRGDFEGDPRHFKPSAARRHVAASPHGAGLVRDRRWATN